MAAIQCRREDWEEVLQTVEIDDEDTIATKIATALSENGDDSDTIITVEVDDDDENIYLTMVLQELDIDLP